MKWEKSPRAPKVAAPSPDDTAPSGWMRWREVAWHVPRLLSGLGPLGPRGPEDGPPVLVIPGFLATDRTTMELRRALARAGWRAHPWLLGMNGGAKKDTMDALTGRLEAIYDGRPILLVGWSLGGMFARQIACRHPEMIRAVVTLGSPFSGNLKTNTNIREFYERIAGHDVDKPPFERIMTKPPVPTLAIWSSKDGIVAPAAARGLPEEVDKSVEIQTLHMGFAVYRPALSWIVREIRVFLTEVEGKAPAMGTMAAT
jgi:pimeloyl-ACP methyl ester carboxylesterase